MTKAFRVLAFLIAALVFVQAFTVAWGVAGLAIWVDEGNDFTSEVLGGDDMPFTELYGMMIHGMSGMMLIPLVALITMIVGLLAKFPGSTKYGVTIFLLVVLQVALGLFGHELSLAGGLHGMNALILLGVAITAGTRAKDTPVVPSDEHRTPIGV
jgi:heme A synthase